MPTEITKVENQIMQPGEGDDKKLSQLLEIEDIVQGRDWYKSVKLVDNYIKEKGDDLDPTVKEYYNTYKDSINNLVRIADDYKSLSDKEKDKYKIDIFNYIGGSDNFNKVVITGFLPEIHYELDGVAEGNKVGAKPRPALRPQNDEEIAARTVNARALNIIQDLTDFRLADANVDPAEFDNFNNKLAEIAKNLSADDKRKIIEQYARGIVGSKIYSDDQVGKDITFHTTGNAMVPDIAKPEEVQQLKEVINTLAVNNSLVDESTGIITVDKQKVATLRFK